MAQARAQADISELQTNNSQWSMKLFPVTRQLDFLEKFVVAPQSEESTAVKAVKVVNFFVSLGFVDQKDPIFSQLCQAIDQGKRRAEHFWITVGKFVENFVETQHPDLAEKAYALFHNLIASFPISPTSATNPQICTKDWIYPDQYWSLVSKKNNLELLSHSYQESQIYFYKLQPQKNGKHAIYILQTIANEGTEYTATLVPVLRGQISDDLQGSFRCALINEKGRKLYLIFAKNQHPTSQGDLIKVNGYDLNRSPAISLGHTRVNAVNSKWWTFVMTGKYGGVACSSDPEALIFITDCFVPPNLTQLFTLVHFGNKAATVKEIHGPIPWRSFSLPDFHQTDRNKLLILLFKPGFYLNPDLLASELSLNAKMAFVTVLAVDPINKPHFKLISSTEIEHLTFLRKVLPVKHKQMLASKLSPAQLSKLSTDLRFVGVAVKHHIFIYEGDIIAVKDFLRHGLSKSSANKKFNTSYFWSSPLQLESNFVSDHYLVTKSLDSKQRTHLMRFNLAPLLNDYRKCANCQKVEESKRRNSSGKRIALFKVCALCKAKNFHLKWKEYPCHYCSIECMKAHWKTHKEIHKAKGLNRS